jgi:hypothetical protein
MAAVSSCAQSGVQSQAKLAFLPGMVQACGIVVRRREPASVFNGH